MPTPRIIVFSGSLRAESWNRKIIEIAGRAAREAGAEVTEINLIDYPLPLFNQDEEAAHGLPDNCLKLKDLFKAHDGLLIGCPEYNSSITGVLKNTIDWISRPRQGEAPLAPFDGKIAGLTAASAGVIGGLRGLFHVRAILQNIRVTVLPNMAAVGRVDQLYDEGEKRLSDEKLHAAVEKVGREVAHICGKLKS